MELDGPEETVLPPEDDQPDEVEISDIELSQASERDAMLAAIMRDQTEKAEHEEEVRQVRARTQGYGRRHIALAFTTVLTLWIWIRPPSALSIPTPEPQPTEQEEATLRLVMYFQAQKIEQYRLDNGRVPVELQDAGPAFQGMEYIRLTDSDYRILGRTSRVILSYSSVEPIDEFVGEGALIFDPTVID